MHMGVYPLKCAFLVDEGKYAGGSGQKLFRCALRDIRMGADATMCLRCPDYIPIEIFQAEKQEALITRKEGEIMINALQQGIPPEIGISQLVFGLDEQKELVTQHLKEVSDGSSRFLVIVGDYGTGKTHLLQFILETSLTKNFISSKIALKPECNFKDNILVYSDLIKHLILPDNRSENALDWIARNVGRRQLPPSVPRNIALAFSKAADQTRQRRRIFLDYISGRPVGIRELRKMASFPRIKLKLENENFNLLVNGMASICRQLEYSGLVLLFDEVENVIASSLTTRQSEKAVSNLIELLKTIDYFSDVYFVFACTPELFEILKVLGVQFNDSNSTKLSFLRSEDLFLLGQEIRKIHGIAFDWEPELVFADSVLENICEKSTSRNGNTREFVKTITQLLNSMQRS